MEETILKRARRLNYPADLIEPIVKRKPIRVGLLSLVCTQEQEEERQWQIIRKKFLQLFDHYKLEAASPDDYLALAFKLALEWVPGFRLVEKPPRRRGAPRMNDDDSLVKVYREIEEIRLASRLKHIGKACTVYLKVHNEEPRWKRIGPRALEGLYNRGRKISLRREESAKAFKESYVGLIGGSFNLREGGLFKMGEQLANGGGKGLLGRTKNPD